MIVGFTGTRRGMTAPQQAAVKRCVAEAISFHHGDCVGADEQAAALALSDGAVVVAHPADVDTHRAFAVSHLECEPLPYLARNRAIVDACETLIAAPGSMEEEVRSGTWATVRYARERGVPVTIVWPDGTGGRE